MLKLDTLNQLKQLKNDIKANRNLMLGTVKGSANKFGFVSLDVGKDVYLPPEEMEKVLPGDRIEIEVVKDAKKKKVAKIERLLSSPTKEFCGKYITKGNAHFIEADIPGMSRWFFVPPQKRKSAKAKDLVKCKVTQHPLKTGKAQAAVIEILGTEQKIGIERDYVCSKYGLSVGFNPEVEVQLESLNESSIASCKHNRKDFTAIPFITIDAESTLDIDDALSVQKTDQGWTLLIAIADPEALIDKGSAIDKQVIERATSIYFPGMHVPMMPHKLASDLCSLNEGQERLAKILQVQIDDQGSLGEFSLDLGFIKSRQRMSYSGVSKALEQDTVEGDLDDELITLLKMLKSVTDALYQTRCTSMLVQPSRNEYYLELNDQQKISAIKEKALTSAHRIVEESMVAANRCVAKFLKETQEKNQINSLFIRHNGVRSDRIEGVQSVLNKFVPSSKESSIADLDGYVKTMKSVRGNDEYKDYELLMSRQLEKSSFSSTSAPHFGMGLSEYTTFTSPLRKAQDYLIHRQLSDILSEKPTEIDASLLESIEGKVSKVRGAVYDVEQWLKCQFMAKNKTPHEAKVLRTFSTGFQVQLLENGIEGFISTKEMEGKYSFNQDLLTLSGKEASFKLDQLIIVELKQVDWSRKQLQFNVKKAQESDNSPE